MLCIITPSAIIKVRTTCCCSLRLQKQTAISRSDVAHGWAGYCDTIIERRREFHVKSHWRSSWPFNAMKVCCMMHLSCESGFRTDPQPEALGKCSPNDDLQRDTTIPLGKMTDRSRKTATTLRISFWTIR